MSGNPETLPETMPETTVRRTPLGRRLASSLRWMMIPTNPVFTLEMRTSGRQRSTYMNRLSFSLVLLAVIALTYFGASSSGFSDGSTGASRAQELQTIAPTLAMWISFLLLIGLAFTGPALVGGAICDERRAGTLPATLTTPLTAGQIIVGKVASKFVHVLVLLALSLPLMLALRLFGGLETSWILGASSIILSFTLLAMSIAVLYSLRARRGTTAAGAASLTAFGLPGVISLAIVQQTARHGATLPNGMPLTELIPWFFSPATLGFMVAELHIGMGGAPRSIWGGGQWQTPWLANSLLNVMLAGLVLFIATRMLRRTMRTLDERHILPPKLRSKKGTSNRHRKGRKSAQTQTELPGETPTIDTVSDSAVPNDSSAEPREPVPMQPEQESIAEIERSGSRTVSDRPVLWRELAQPAFRSIYVRAVAVLACLVSLIWLYVDVGIDTPATHLMVPIIGTLLLIVMVAGSASGSIASERETKTWGVLLTTPLKPRQILFGKIGGALRRQWLIGGVIGLHIVCSLIAGAMPVSIAIGLVAVLLASCLFAASIGTAAALMIRSARRATTVTYLTLATLWIFPFVALGIIESLGIMHEIETLLLSIASFINPIYYVYSLAAAIDSWPVRFRFEWPRGALEPVPYFRMLFFAVVLWVGISAVILKLMCLWFSRFTERTS